MPMTLGPPPSSSRTAEPDAIGTGRFLRLIGVFLAAFLLVVGLKAFFAHLHDELGVRSANERARLFIGEEIVQMIREMEKDVYHMPTLAGEAAQQRKVQEIRQHVAKLEHDLQVLKTGGTVMREVDLNLEGRDKMVREVRYTPPGDGGAYVMELIEIAPLLVQINQKSEELRALLGQRAVLRERQDTAGFFAIEQKVSLFLKHLPPYFHRLNENANRLFFESSERLDRLEAQLALERTHYGYMENLLVVLVVSLAAGAGFLFVREMRESNRKLQLAWEEMRAAKEESERASRAKSEFVARMSHELRTPMNAILGFAQLLEGEELDEEHKSYVTEINRAGVHLLELINQVLDLSKIEAGSMTLESIPFDLIRTVDDVAAIVADRARGRGLHLRFFASPELPTLVMGDPTRLRQVLINLMGNAVKFTHQGGIDLRIMPAAGAERIEFSVLDTGIGMDAATLARLFRPFAQADESITRNYGGTGLGLMISRDLVQAMGGDIAVESTSGVGSCFRFSLPARAVPDAPARPQPLLGYRAMMTCTEDHQVGVLSTHLAALGAEVLPAHGMAEALPLLQEAPARPWVFIGKNACLGSVRAVREGHGHPQDIRLLVADGPDTARSADADAVLNEPFTYSRLLELVECLQKAQGDCPVVQESVPGTRGGTTAAVAASPVPEMPAAAPARVLLVEDNRVNQLVAGRMLTRFGLSCDMADNGREAVEKFCAGAYSLVLMDMQMPEMDGLDATRRLRAWEAEEGRPRTPVIAMTANAMAEDRDRCMEAGMDEHLSKPVAMDKLAAILDRWIPGQALPSPG